MDTLDLKRVSGVKVNSSSHHLSSRSTVTRLRTGQKRTKRGKRVPKSSVYAGTVGDTPHRCNGRRTGKERGGEKKGRERVRGNVGLGNPMVSNDEDPEEGEGQILRRGAPDVANPTPRSGVLGKRSSGTPTKSPWTNVRRPV